MNWSSQQQNALKSMITSGFKNVGRSVFIEAQRRVPVVTGNLKSSGSVAFTPDGFEITYSAPYASDIELGRRSSTGAAASLPWKQNVPRHIRRTKTGNKVPVAAHTKTYTSGKPTQMPDGSWRVFSTSSVSRGQHFLGGSLKTTLVSILSYNNGLQKYLETDTI